MEYRAYARIFRRITAALLALTAAVLLCAPTAFAEETGEEPAERVIEYDGIAAQLSAVARAEGREIAAQMVTEAFRAVSPLETDDAETAAAQTSTAAVATSTEGPGVVVHTRSESWSLSGIWPFFLVVAVAMAGIGIVLLSVRRAHFGGRRAAYARSYRPMRDLTFREETFEKRSAWRLNR